MRGSRPTWLVAAFWPALAAAGRSAPAQLVSHLLCAHCGLEWFAWGVMAALLVAALAFATGNGSWALGWALLTVAMAATLSLGGSCYCGCCLCCRQFTGEAPWRGLAQPERDGSPIPLSDAQP